MMSDVDSAGVYYLTREAFESRSAGRVASSKRTARC